MSAVGVAPTTGGWEIAVRSSRTLHAVMRIVPGRYATADDAAAALLAEGAKVKVPYHAEVRAAVTLTAAQKRLLAYMIVHPDHIISTGEYVRSGSYCRVEIPGEDPGAPFRLVAISRPVVHRLFMAGLLIDTRARGGNITNVEYLPSRGAIANYGPEVLRFVEATRPLDVSSERAH